MASTMLATESVTTTRTIRDLSDNSIDSTVEVELNVENLRLSEEISLECECPDDVGSECSETDGNDDATDEEEEEEEEDSLSDGDNDENSISDEETRFSDDNDISSAGIPPEELWPIQTRDQQPEVKRKPPPKKTHNKLPKEVQRTNKERRKEKIAAKRSDRAKLKGFDVRKVDKILVECVHNQTDVYAFPPMGDWGLKTTQQMAACYGLQSSVCGGAKKRFVMVRFTSRTCMPTEDNLDRLISLRMRSEVTHEEVCETQRLEVQASKKGKQKKMKKKTPDAPMMITEDPSGMYAVPMTFVPGGLNSTRESFDVQVTTTTITTTEQENISSEDEESNQSRLGIGAGSAPAVLGLQPQDNRGFAAFERHTTGFGSRMLVRMGYTQGKGLGAEEQGIRTPLQHSRQTGRLGLGAVPDIPSS